MQTHTERLAWMKKYRLKNSEKFREYHRIYRVKEIEKRKRRKREAFRKRVELINRNNQDYMKKMPILFGSFEKATYVVYKYKTEISYAFTTTCRNTEECIEIMKKRYEKGKLLSIYKIQYGVKKLIFKGVL